jgi:zinc/manganese transport system ATP-binding protein
MSSPVLSTSSSAGSSVGAVVPAVELRDAHLAYGQRTLWSGLDLEVEAGQFITVLGPNGAGKSSLVKVILGLVPLVRGQALVQGQPVQRGNPGIGYIPQQRGFRGDVPLRGRDFVRLGVDGSAWGVAPRRAGRRKVEELIARVGAEALADVPLGRMSGGEQQQLRVAQALGADPSVLLCDEPLLSLDLRHQQRVVDLLHRQCREHGAAVLFVTHEINPVLPVTDRVLYLNDGRFRIGPPEQVMTSEVLSQLYRAPVEVLRRGEKIIVLGADAADAHHNEPAMTA